MSFAAKTDAGPKRNMNVAPPKSTSLAAHKRALKKITSVVALQAAGSSSKPGTAPRKKVVLGRAQSSSHVNGVVSQPTSRAPSPRRASLGATDVAPMNKTLKKSSTEPQLLGHVRSIRGTPPKENAGLLVLDGPPQAGGKRARRPSVVGGPAEEVEEEPAVLGASTNREVDVFTGSNKSLMSSRANSEAGDEEEEEEQEEVVEYVETEAEKLFKRDFLEAKFTDDMEREMWDKCWAGNGFDAAVRPDWGDGLKAQLVEHTRELVQNHLSIAGCMGPAGLRKWSMSFLSRRLHKEIVAAAEAASAATEAAPGTTTAALAAIKLGDNGTPRAPTAVLNKSLPREDSTGSLSGSARASPLTVEEKPRGPTPLENKEAAAVARHTPPVESHGVKALPRPASGKSPTPEAMANVQPRPPSAGTPCGPPPKLSTNYVFSKIEKINRQHSCTNSHVSVVRPVADRPPAVASDAAVKPQ